MSNETNEEKCISLEHRVLKIETYFKIAIAIAIILGVSNGYFLSVLNNTQKKVDEFDVKVEKLYKNFKTEVTTSLESIETAKEKALKKINTDLTNVAKQKATEVVNIEKRKSLSRDKSLRKWLRLIYSEADKHDDRSNGANGWWQEALIRNNQNVINQTNW